MRVANEGPLEVSCEKNTCSCGPDATYPKNIFHRSLTREKALIAAGQKEIADMQQKYTLELIKYSMSFLTNEFVIINENEPKYPK